MGAFLGNECIREQKQGASFPALHSGTPPVTKTASSEPLLLSAKTCWSIGPAVTREQSPAFLRNSNGILDLPGPTQEAA